MEKRCGEPIPCELLIVVEELMACFGPTQSLKIHCQERHIGADISVPQSIREFDAIEDPDAVI
jgi:hypothetical protein